MAEKKKKDNKTEETKKDGSRIKKLIKDAKKGPVILGPPPDPFAPIEPKIPIMGPPPPVPRE